MEYIKKLSPFNIRRLDQQMHSLQEIVQGAEIYVATEICTLKETMKNEWEKCWVSAFVVNYNNILILLFNTRPAIARQIAQQIAILSTLHKNTIV